MSTTTIILAHYKEREGNLKRIVDDILSGTVIPQKIIVIIDNPSITFSDPRVEIIRSTQHFLPAIRFAIGMICDTDFCFFLDDDLTVGNRTIENFLYHADQFPDRILGLEGSTLGKTETPYSNDIPVKRGNRPSHVPVDIVIRTYFCPVRLLAAGFQLRSEHPEYPKTSLDDIFLCLGNKYLNGSGNYVIPVTPESDLKELPDGGVGQSFDGNHYKNRNIVCRELMDIYE